MMIVMVAPKQVGKNHLSTSLNNDEPATDNYNCNRPISQPATAAHHEKSSSRPTTRNYDTEQFEYSELVFPEIQQMTPAPGRRAQVD
jgi:hypothetical protein